ncbi:MAG: hypothetical protein ABSE55_14440 [Terracidiphilus sp.]|jgi:uncharacterized membrane protein
MRVSTSVCMLAGLLLAAPVMQASSISVNLGQSAQDYVLTGQGTANPYGTYLNTQGSCAAGASSTTCSLTGAFTGSTAGYTGGTYDFVTTYLGTGPSPLGSISENPIGGANEDYFYFNSIPAGTTMFLQLDESGGPDYNIPIFAGGSFIGGFSVYYVSPVCGGTSLGSDPCDQIYVGQFLGATYSGEVTGSATFDSSTVVTGNPVPEPEWLTLGGLPLLLAMIRRRQLAGVRA